MCPKAVLLNTSQGVYVKRWCDMAQVAAAGAESDHPLRVYREYLSHIFRKAPLPPEQELLELSYCDYLQARPACGRAQVCLACRIFALSGAAAA